VRVHRRRFLGTCLAIAVLAGCSLREAACGPQERSTSAGTPASNVPPQAVPNAPGRFKIVFLGDSLTAGLGLLTDEAYPSVLQEMFANEGYDNVEVINAGISGDTTSGGAHRVDDLFEPDVRVLVVALGGNDALRGISPTQTRENLTAILDKAKAQGVGILLAGMEAPTNLGPDYQKAFHETFVDLAHQYRDGLVYMPFLLEGVAGNPALNQADLIHPNKEGARLVAEHMYPKLRLLVDQMGGGG
jgi:acyl-CoA thioesterase-1